MRLDDKSDSQLRELAARTGKGESEFVREAIRRQVAIARYEDLGRRLAPFAGIQGWLTDEVAFQEVS